MKKIFEPLAKRSNRVEDERVPVTETQNKDAISDSVNNNRDVTSTITQQFNPTNHVLHPTNVISNASFSMGSELSPEKSTIMSSKINITRIPAVDQNRTFIMPNIQSNDRLINFAPTTISYPIQYTNSPLHTRILNVGNHKIFVSSMINTPEGNSNLFYDNYDTLDTFEACKLNLDFAKLANIVDPNYDAATGEDMPSNLEIVTDPDKIEPDEIRERETLMDHGRQPIHKGSSVSHLSLYNPSKRTRKTSNLKKTSIFSRFLSAKPDDHGDSKKLSMHSSRSKEQICETYNIDIPNNIVTALSLSAEHLRRNKQPRIPINSDLLVDHDDTDSFNHLRRKSLIDEHHTFELFKSNLDDIGNSHSRPLKEDLANLLNPPFDSMDAQVMADSLPYRAHSYLPFKSSDKPRHPTVFKRVRKRLVNKIGGSTNVVQSNISNRKQHFLSDIYTTLLDTRWRWSVLIFAAAFLLSWTLFALLWWLVAFAHGDFEQYNNLEASLGQVGPTVVYNPDIDERQEVEKGGIQHGLGVRRTCFAHAEGFVSALLFSIETQHTIGYGYRYITTECPEGVLLFVIQAITGAMIQGFVIGLIFSKLSRPKKRAVTLMFSRNAVICTRDGQLCLLVRIGDMRKSHIIDARTRAYLFRKKVTLEGEVIPLHPHHMSLSFDPDGVTDRIFLGWPSILVHRISEGDLGDAGLGLEGGYSGPGRSPLYNLGAKDLAEEKFEMVVILEGMIEASGMSMQARTSYLPNEILWGHRFQKLITFVREDGDYNVDYSRFHDTVPFNMPSCSARDLDIFRRKFREEKRKINMFKDVSLRDNNLENFNANELISKMEDMQLLFLEIKKRFETAFTGHSL
ncbi:unnamed protein product [Gordionus sp. m RMFG-2023]|uniref:uncharacterized protein LOC135923047 n=1 Tax=Gordionus sp. m RMFG-2023 TaxID=3053472 RepID=UPI0030E2C441